MGGTNKTLLVWGGQTYNETLTLAANGTNLKRDPASGEAIISAGGSGDVIFTSKSNCTIDGFTIANGTNGIDLLNGTATGGIVKNCRIRNNTNNGVMFNKAPNCTVNNCAVYFNASTSDYGNICAFQQGATGNTVTQCTIYGGSVGVYATRSNASITTLRDCIISGTSSLAIWAESTNTISPITYCDVVGSTIGVTLGTGCTTGDPLLHDPANGDFHLDTGSPAHNTASDGLDMGYRYSSTAL
jgi:nitrous oxidase accessory protein NosD